MFESAGGSFNQWLSNLLGGSSGVGGAWSGKNAPGTIDMGGGYGFAPGTTESGQSYGLPDPTKGMDSWWGGASNKDLAGALKDLGGQAGAAAAGKGQGPIMPDMRGGGSAVGRPGGVQSLGPLLQLLNQRRDQLLQSATGGVGAGQVPQTRPTAGLLGF